MSLEPPAEAGTGGPPDVVLCTPEGRAAAEHFHDVTGRPLLRVTRPEEVRRVLAAPGTRTVLLSLGAVPLGFTASVAGEAHRRGIGLGWIFGWNGPKAALRHARKTADFSFGDAPEPALVWSSQTFGTLRDATVGDQRLLSGPDPDLPKVLATRRPFVSLSSHGLGIDMWLGEGLLCSAPGPGAPLLHGQALHPCFQGGPCLRARRGPDGIEQPARFDVVDVASDVLVLDSCRSLRIAPGADSACLASAAALGPHAGAVLAALADVEGLPAVHMAAWALLRDGAPLHGALRLANASNMATMRTAPWVLLGDPLARVAEPSRAPADGRQAVGEGAASLVFTAAPPGTTVTVRGEAAGPGRAEVWVQRVPGDRRAAVVLRNVRAPKIALVDRDDDPASLLRDELLAASPAVATSRQFMATAADLLPGEHGRQASELLAALDRRLQATTRLGQGLPAPVVEGGWQEDRQRWYGRERSSWQRLQAGLAETMSRFSRELGPLQTSFHIGARALPASEGEPARPCPYCGSPTEWRRFRLDSLSRVRHAWMCWACDMIHDGPEDRPPQILHGPFSVVVGRPAEFRLETGPLPDSGVRQVRFAVERVPWDVDVRVTAGQAATPDAVADDSYHVVTVRSAPPGLYFVVGAVVQAGDMSTVRRPLHVVGRDAA